MKIVITCGGTGGHITPALAIADTVRENHPRAAIVFVGAEGGMELELVPRAGYRIGALRVKGFSRSLSPANLKLLFQTATAVREAREYLSSFLPDIVIGTGGYACYPTLRAAAQLGIPTAVHESNAYPGLAVRRLAPRMERVWLNFDEARAHLSPRARCLTVGNPLPRGVGSANPMPLPAGCRRMLLSFGGSLGATALNDAALALMEQLRSRPDIFYLHAAGKREYERVLTAFHSRGLERYPNLSLVPFIHDMPRQMASADVVVCRAGAMSISELAAAARAAILVPSPNVTGDHQLKNAKALAGKGAAVLLEERKVSALPETALSLLDDPARRKALSLAIGGFAHPDANRLILQDIHRLIAK